MEILNKLFVRIYTSVLLAIISLSKVLSSTVSLTPFTLAALIRTRTPSFILPWFSSQRGDSGMLKSRRKLYIFVMGNNSWKIMESN